LSEPQATADLEENQDADNKPTTSDPTASMK
jgi:hypothetical protein